MILCSLFQFTIYTFCKTKHYLTSRSYLVLLTVQDFSGLYRHKSYSYSSIPSSFSLSWFLVFRTFVIVGLMFHSITVRRVLLWHLVTLSPNLSLSFKVWQLGSFVIKSMQNFIMVEGSTSLYTPLHFFEYYSPILFPSLMVIIICRTKSLKFSWKPDWSNMFS